MSATFPSPLTLRAPVSFGDERFLMFVLDELADQLARTNDDVIRLTLGKVEESPCAAVNAAMVDAATDFDRSSLVFPGGLPQLRERLADEYREKCGVTIEPGRFVVSVGTSMAFRNLNQILAGPGDEVLVPMPYYPLYVFTAQLAGASVRYYKIDPQTLTVDLESLAAAMTERTRIVVVNSPGNPLGNVLSLPEFAEIDRIVAGRAVLISDEIYNNCQFDDPPFSAVQLADPVSPIVVTNAFSKGHRMYARRVGYSMVPAELVEPLTVIQHHTLLTTDPVPQFGAIAALDNQDGVADLVARYRARRDYTVAAFAGVPGVTALPSRGGFYLTLDCSDHLRGHPGWNSLDLAVDLLRKTHVATVPGADFGLAEALRLSYTSAGFEEGIDRLVGYFTG